MDSWISTNYSNIMFNTYTSLKVILKPGQRSLVVKVSSIIVASQLNNKLEIVLFVLFLTSSLLVYTACCAYIMSKYIGVIFFQKVL